MDKPWIILLLTRTSVCGPMLEDGERDEIATFATQEEAEASARQHDLVKAYGGWVFNCETGEAESV